MALGGFLDDIAGWVAGDGNEPGTPETRELGYDPEQVADAAVIALNQPAGTNMQQELLVMGVAGVALIFLLQRKG